MPKPKTEQSFRVIDEKAKQIGYGEWVIKLFIHKQEVVGFEEEKPPLIRFRATGKEPDKVEDAI